jgi:hypothetical protein
VSVHVLEADRGATETDSLAVGSLRRQLEAGRPHGLLPGAEGTVTTILHEISLGAIGEKDAPRGLEGATRLVETLGKAARAL